VKGAGASLCLAICWNSANIQRKLHAGLAELVVDAGADFVFLAGPEMKALAEALPRDLKTSTGQMSRNWNRWS
jgi:UDP-N-acetylmuramyl pentapeptide synthase